MDPVTPHLEDSDLIQRIKGGDRAAAEVLLRRYSDGVYDYLCRMLGPGPDAEDVAQETLVKALRAIPKYEERGQFRAWICAIARREALQLIRRRQVELRKYGVPVEVEVVERIEESRRGPLADLIGMESMQLIQENVLRLPKPEREVFLMRTMDGLTFAEIASAMQCPINTALGRMRNASLKLRKWVKNSLDRRA